MEQLSEGGAAAVQIGTRSDGGETTITVAGDLDMSNVSALERAVAAATGEPPQRLVFDLAALRFMDSAGIAVLLSAAERVPNVRLHAPSPAVRRVIEMTGLTEILAIEP